MGTKMILNIEDISKLLHADTGGYRRPIPINNIVSIGQYFHALKSKTIFVENRINFVDYGIEDIKVDTEYRDNDNYAYGVLKQIKGVFNSAYLKTPIRRDAVDDNPMSIIGYPSVASYGPSYNIDALHGYSFEIPISYVYLSNATRRKNKANKTNAPFTRFAMYTDRFAEGMNSHVSLKVSECKEFEGERPGQADCYRTGQIVGHINYPYNIDYIKEKYVDGDIVYEDTFDKESTEYIDPHMTRPGIKNLLYQFPSIDLNVQSPFYFSENKMPDLYELARHIYRQFFSFSPYKYLGIDDPFRDDDIYVPPPIME